MHYTLDKIGSAYSLAAEKLAADMPGSKPQVPLKVQHGPAFGGVGSNIRRMATSDVPKRGVTGALKNVASKVAPATKALGPVTQSAAATGTKVLPNLIGKAVKPLVRAAA